MAICKAVFEPFFSPLTEPTTGVRKGWKYYRSQPLAILGDDFVRFLARSFFRTNQPNTQRGATYLTSDCGQCRGLHRPFFEIGNPPLNPALPYQKWVGDVDVFLGQCSDFPDELTITAQVNPDAASGDLARRCGLFWRLAPVWPTPIALTRQSPQDCQWTGGTPLTNGFDCDPQNLIAVEPDCDCVCDNANQCPYTKSFFAWNVFGSVSYNQTSDRVRVGYGISGAVSDCNENVSCPSCGNAQNLQCNNVFAPLLDTSSPFSGNIFGIYAVGDPNEPTGWITVG